MAAHTGRRGHRARVILLALATLALPGCTAGGTSATAASVVRMDSPAPPGSRVPDLAPLPDGRLVLSWIQPDARHAHAFVCSIFDGSRWTPPATIATGDSLVVNAADFPGVRPLGGARLAAHWRVTRSMNACDVRIAQSDDLGRTWSAPVTPHRDDTATEHSFVSLIPAPRGVRAIWLDGRNTVGHEEGEADMTLRTALVGGDGRLTEEAVLDARVCDCCQTAAVLAGGDVVVAYRDRDPDEVRDIAIVRSAGQGWSRPRPLHADGWRIAGCPVNGPALDARGTNVVATWFAAGEDTPRVFVAFSADRGVSFGRPIEVDAGNPSGHVHVAWAGDDAAVVTWLETSDRDVRLCARRVCTTHTLGATVSVAKGVSPRGFARLASSGGHVFVAWTEGGDAPRIRVASLDP